jgi:copper homeostasis protein
MPLEIACFNVQSAINAVRAGADRIELCANQELGGTTPSDEDFKRVQDVAVPVPVNVMVRPRGGNFEYTDAEFENMKKTLIRLRGLGADGFVFGILKDGKVDIKRCQELVKLADGHYCTFHRAFDELEDKQAGLEDVIRCGFSGILTSGGMHDAIHGTTMLRQLYDLSKGSEIDIIVGGGVRSSNVTSLKTETGATWYHSSALTDETHFASEQEISSLLKVVHA